MPTVTFAGAKDMKVAQMSDAKFARSLCVYSDKLNAAKTAGDAEAYKKTNREWERRIRVGFVKQFFDEMGWFPSYLGNAPECNKNGVCAHLIISVTRPQSNELPRDFPYQYGFECDLAPYGDPCWGRDCALKQWARTKAAASEARRATAFLAVTASCSSC